MNRKKRILILGNSRLSVFKFRGELVEALVRAGCDVWVCFPNGPFGEGENAAKQFGCHYIENHMERRSTNLVKDFGTLAEYFSIMRRVRPDAVLGFTVKPDVYGGVVCRVLKIPFLPNITGLGKGLDEGGMVQKLTIFLYRLAVKKAACVFFQNKDDQLFFNQNRIVCPRSVLLPGSGVNLDRFQPLPYPGEQEPIRFLFASRIMKTKGIENFLEAAHRVRLIHPNVEFHICGFCEEEYEAEIKKRVSAGDVCYHGLVDDVRRFIAFCHCLVLPTFHPEGMSNVLLEGAACARALIATDRPGCREIIENGVSGYLIRQKDSEALTQKILCFICLPYLGKIQMGLAGRKKVESQFSRTIVVDAYMNELNLV